MNENQGSGQPLPERAYHGERIQSNDLVARDETRADQAALPSPNKTRHIEIDAKDFGFLVTVGCQQFCIEKAETLISKLSKYLHKPQETEKEYYDGKLF
jgi:hypothetical protein